VKNIYKEEKKKKENLSKVFFLQKKKPKNYRFIIATAKELQLFLIWSFYS